MEELIDSVALADDPAALRARLVEHGYLFFRGLLPTGPLAEAGAAVVRALARDGWTDPAGVPLFPARAVNLVDAARDRGYLAAAAGGPFNRIPYLPRLRGLVRSLLGPEAFSYPVKVLRAVFPEQEAGRPQSRLIHQDFFGAHVCDMLTTWVPLMPIPVRLGGLALLPGSHLGPPLKPDPLSPPDAAHWATADFELGDVVLFHSLTSHAGMPNRGDRLRLSQDTRWQSADEPAPARMIYGPAAARRLDPGAAPVRELYSGPLSREPWWEPVPAGLRIAEDDHGADVDAGTDPDRRPPGDGIVRSRFFPVHPSWSFVAVRVRG